MHPKNFALLIFIIALTCKDSFECMNLDKCHLILRKIFFFLSSSHIICYIFLLSYGNPLSLVIRIGQPSEFLLKKFNGFFSNSFSLLQKSNSYYLKLILEN